MKLFINLLVITICANVSIAQKLPNIQENSLWAPVNLTINGKTSLWNNQFQAHNKATDINYSISNNDENLFLIIQVTYPDICDKALRGGITFTVSPANRKDTKKQLSITFPVLEGTSQSVVPNMFARKRIEKREAEGNDISTDDLNVLLMKESKTIKLTGITAIPDTEISIYNEFSIKAAGQFDHQLRYTYQLAVPLKYLKLPDGGDRYFNYNIKLNGPPETNIPHGLAPPGPPVAITAAAATDFWGKYTLAKK